MIREISINGNIRYGIQPKSETSFSMPEMIMLDSHTLEIVTDAVVLPFIPVDPTITIQIGDKVEDIINKTVGVISSRAEYLNGCVFFGVETAAKDSAESKFIWMDENRLKVVKGGVTKQLKKEVKITGSGGPSTRIQAQVVRR